MRPLGRPKAPHNYLRSTTVNILIDRTYWINHYKKTKRRVGLQLKFLCGRKGRRLQTHGSLEQAQMAGSFPRHLWFNQIVKNLNNG